MIDDVYPEQTALLARKRYQADRVIARLARALGVRVLRCKRLPASFWHHPTLPCGFCPARRLVLFDGPRDAFRLYLPHEIVHVVWPDRVFTGPEDEWSCGMIDYELAWLKRLCTELRAPECLEAWSVYASEGGASTQDTRESARRAVRNAKLPSPWLCTLVDAAPDSR